MKPRLMATLIAPRPSCARQVLYGPLQLLQLPQYVFQKMCQLPDLFVRFWRRENPRHLSHELKLHKRETDKRLTN